MTSRQWNSETASIEGDNAVPPQSRPDAQLPPDMLRDDRYARVRPLGRGGMGEVFEYRDQELGIPVAIKRLRTDRVTDAGRMRFRKQMNALAAVAERSEHVAMVRAFFLEDDTQYLVTECIRGASLSEMLRQDDVGFDAALRACNGAATGLAALHDARIVHRDIKPSNIMVRADDGIGKIIDLGLAGLASDDDESADAGRSAGPSLDAMTDPGVRMGTLQYMSPEQVRGVDAIRAMDTWAFGCVLRDVCERFPDDAPESLERLVDQCCMLRPERRPRMDDVVKRLRNLSRDESDVVHEPASSGRVPSPLLPAVGRTTEITRLVASLAHRRLVTIWGVAGIGKTTLAQQVGGVILGQDSESDDPTPSFADGVWFARVSSAREPAGVLRLIASAIDWCSGLEGVDSARLRAQLVDRLRTRHTLVILDGVDDLAEAVRPDIQMLLEECPQLHVLVTGSRLIHVPVEHPFPLAGLTTSSSEAVDLFVHRAQMHQPAFLLDRITRPLVESICQEVDGVPLAIEFAAANLATAPLAQIERRLRDGLPGRGQLEVAIASALEGLDPAIQSCAREWTVFEHGWTLDAAIAVSGPSADMARIETHLETLVDRSVVRVEFGPSGSVRYSMLNPVRRAIAAMSHIDAAMDEVASRHADWGLGLAERADRALTGANNDGPVLARRNQAEWMSRLDTESANLRRAFAYLAEHRARHDELARLVIALDFYWSRRGTAKFWLAAAESALSDTVIEHAQIRIDLFNALGILAFEGEDWATSERWYRAALEEVNQQDDPRTAAKLHSNLGLTVMHQHRFEEARSLQKQALELQMGQPMASRIELNLAAVLHLVGDVEGASQRLIRLTQEFRHRGDRYATMLCLRNLSQAVCAKDQLLSRRLSWRAFVHAHWLEDGPQAGKALRLLAASATATEQKTQPALLAEILAGAALADPGGTMDFDDAAGRAFRDVEARVDRDAVRMRQVAMESRGGWRAVDLSAASA